MGLGAIVVIGTEREAFGSTAPQGIVQVPGSDALLPAPLACVDILGRSMVERAIERFTRADVELLTVLVPAGSVCEVRPFADTFETVNVQVVADVFSAITQQLHDYSQKGIEHSFVASANVYAETDLLDFFYFHREARQRGRRPRVPWTAKVRWTCGSSIARERSKPICRACLLERTKPALPISSGIT